MKRTAFISILLVLCVLSSRAHQSFVTIPDPNFLAALIENGIDTDNDGQISFTEAEVIKRLKISEMGIQDLTGIEAFINLSVLLCQRNQLTSLDLSGAPELRSLYCSNNQLNSLIVSSNHSLEELYCKSNQLSSLDLSGAPELSRLNCSENQITSLDVSNNTQLWTLYCNSNQIGNLDVSNNPLLFEFSCDENLLTNLELTGNHNLHTLSCKNNQLSILDLSQNLDLGYLDCSGNQFTRLDLSKNRSWGKHIPFPPFVYLCNMPTLTEVCYWKMPVQVGDEVIISGSPNVTFNDECFEPIPDPAFLQALLDAGTDVNRDGKISQNEAWTITALDLSRRGISDLTGIRMFCNLTKLDCSHNRLTAMNLEGCTKLSDLNCKSNRFTELDFSGCPNLIKLNCNSNHQLRNLNISGCPDLKVLYCGFNQLASLNVTACTELTDLICNSNHLTELDVRSNPHLQILYCSNNLLTSLDLCDNILIGSRTGSHIDLSLGGMPMLEEVFVSTQPFPLPGMVLNTEGSPNIRFNTECDGQYVPIPDPAFLQALISRGVDSNGDSLISYEEAESVITLKTCHILSDEPWCAGCVKITDLTGIEAFINLDTLFCPCAGLEYLNLSNLLKLRYLDCHGNLISSLDISNSRALTNLNCSGNRLYNLDISNNTALKDLAIGDMPTLLEVCVWEMPFPPSGVNVDSSGSPNVEFSKECGVNNDSIPPKITILSPVPDSTYFVNFSNPEVHVQIEEQNLKQSQLMFDGEEKWISFGKEIKYTLRNIPSIGQGRIWVIAEDMSGNVARDSVFFHWTHLDVFSIAVPRNLRATNVGMNSIDLKWDYSEGGFCINLHYFVFVDDQLVDNSFSTSYTLTQCAPNTTYSISVAARKSCWRGSYMQSLKSDPILVTTLKPTAGIDAQATLEFKIYPNPTYAFLTIENWDIDQYTIVLSDLNGRILVEKKETMNSHQIDLSSFQPGVYLITIRSKDFVTTKKIIKL